MSLHTLASHLQKAGRGEDKVLVHMTPKEVNSLQTLAMAHGGSLTINPETGLPEAGFLKSLLPMVAGFFLGPAGIGLTAMQSALAVGALGTAATGSLGKGFMMGMGAYGGAGLGQGLTATGASATTPTTSTLGGSTPNVGMKTVDMVPKTTPQTIGGTNTFGNVNMEAGMKPFSLNDVPAGMGQGNPNSIMMQNAPQGFPVDTSPMARYTSNMKADILNPIQPNVTPPAPAATNMSPKLDVPRVDARSDLSRGFDRATDSWEGAKEFWDATPKGTGYGLAATGASYLQEQQEEAAAEAKAKADAMAAARRGTIRPYEFSTEQDPSAYANTSTSESRYFFEPRFKALPTQKAADGGAINSSETLSLPDRPPMEKASDAQAIGRNNSFPMANIRQPAYSSPTNRPLSQAVIDQSGGPEVDPYTGQPKFASGGIAMLASGGASDAEKTQPKQNLKYTYNPETMQYTKVETATQPTQNNGFRPLGFLGLPGNPYGGTGRGNKGISNGSYFGLPPGMFGLTPGMFVDKQKAPEPTVTTSTVGGMSAPYIPPGQAPIADPSAAPAMGLGSVQNMSMVPNIQLQPQKTPEQQLGLEAFYPMMEQQLAMKGQRLQAQGYADGGVTATGGIDLHVPINFGGGAGGGNGFGPSANGYSAAGSGSGSNVGQTDSFNSMPTNNASMGLQNQMQQYAGMGVQGFADGGMAAGGYSLGGYSDGGRLLRGPGDGVSDSIPASIGDRQPARLADGEFVVPARIVSEIGNGSTEAGARKLYAMMDRVQKARKKTVGKSKVAVNTRADKLLPA
jgi:hypothetical protein